jgi:hypothetical protein
MNIKRKKIVVSAKTNMQNELAGKLMLLRPQRAYAIPYYTLDGNDTEYLISNPNNQVTQITLVIFGLKCEIVKREEITLKPNCTQTVRLRSIVAENAGQAILVSSLEIIAHILYLSEKSVAVTGGELAGSDNLFSWPRREQSRTYGFGYRAKAILGDSVMGSVFVSNPHQTAITGSIVFYNQKCSPTKPKSITIKPGCTVEYKFPKESYGYGRIQVSNQAVINVLHFAGHSKAVAAAELLDESNKLTVPSIDPKPKSKILFDDTHSCRPGATNDWTDYEKALTNVGFSVAHYTASVVTLVALKKYDVFVIVTPRLSYTSAEKKAISDFVNQGGGLLIVQDFGNAPWSVPTREILNYFGANDDNNIIDDPTNNMGNGQIDDVIFDYQRNFFGHPITDGWKSFHVDAATSLFGKGWDDIVETDDDSNPSRRPVLIARSFGEGRIVAFGDSNTWANHLIGNLENEKFGIRCAEWLLFRI